MPIQLSTEKEEERRKIIELLEERKRMLFSSMCLEPLRPKKEDL